jgi:hypothetical protein
MDQKSKPVPAPVIADMNKGERLRYAIATQGLDKPKGKAK